MLLVLHKTPEHARAIGERIEGPLFYMMLGGVGSIGMSIAELGRLGYRWSSTRSRRSTPATRPCASPTRRWRRDAGPDRGRLTRHETRRVHDLIDLDRMLEIERRTVEREAPRRRT